jgi:hypothetical protein
MLGSPLQIPPTTVFVLDSPLLQTQDVIPRWARLLEVDHTPPARLLVVLWPIVGGNGVLDDVPASACIDLLGLRGKTANDLHLCERRARGAGERARCAGEGGPGEGAKGGGRRHGDGGDAIRTLFSVGSQLGV